MTLPLNLPQCCPVSVNLTESLQNASLSWPACSYQCVEEEQEEVLVIVVANTWAMRNTSNPKFPQGTFAGKRIPHSLSISGSFSETGNSQLAQKLLADKEQFAR